MVPVRGGVRRQAVCLAAVVAKLLLLTLSSDMDYYAILGIDRNADARAVDSAFRRLALQWHPLRCQEAGAEEKFEEICQAFEVLKSRAWPMQEI